MPIRSKDRRKSSSIRDKGRLEEVALFRVVFDFEQVKADTIFGSHVLLCNRERFLMVKGRGKGEKSSIIVFNHRRTETERRGDLDDAD